MSHPLRLTLLSHSVVLPVPDKYSCGMLLALAIWLMIFMTRPHKEERFLFPVYPLVCFAVVYAVERLKVSWWAGRACATRHALTCARVHRAFSVT